MLEAGVVLCGKYRIEQLLGKGGMALVARARHMDLDQPVAIKLLLPEVLKNEGMVKRFRREALAMVQLKSEHVCRVFDIGVLESGAPFMVMEYLEGKDLDAILHEQGPLAPGFAVDLVLQACEALAEAHALGIVHRDIKPANCFLTRGPDGEPLLKVLDFGISKALGFTEGAITTSQTLIGSPVYMSPEQMSCSKDVDARVDIWALGVALYELLSGRQPFLGDNFAALCLAVTTQPVPPLADVRLPDGLTGVIARCLEKQPRDRFASIAELTAALAPFAGTSAQGERSRARTARMLGRASAPAPAGISDNAPAGLRGGNSKTIVSAGAARRHTRRRMSALSTVTDLPVPASPDEGVHTTAHDMTGPLRSALRPGSGRPWPRSGVALFVSIVVLGVALGVVLGVVRGDDGPAMRGRPEAGRVGRPDSGVRPWSAVEGSRVPADVPGRDIPAPREVAEERGLDAVPAGPRTFDDGAPDAETRGTVASDAPDAETRGTVASGAQTHGGGAIYGSTGDAARRPRRQASPGGERGNAAGRPVSPRESRATSRTDRAERPPPATSVQSLLDDAAFGSRE